MYLPTTSISWLCFISWLYPAPRHGKVGLCSLAPSLLPTAPQKQGGSKRRRRQFCLRAWPLPATGFRCRCEQFLVERSKNQRKRVQLGQQKTTGNQQGIYCYIPQIPINQHICRSLFIFLLQSCLNAQTLQPGSSSYHISLISYISLLQNNFINPCLQIKRLLTERHEFC